MPVPAELKLLATRVGRCIPSSKKIEINEEIWDVKKKTRYFARKNPEDEDKYSRSLDLQEEILTDIKDMIASDIRITTMELCAIRALRVGLYSGALLQNINAIRALMCSGVIVRPHSSAAMLAQPARENIPLVINEKLEKSPMALSSRELLEGIYGQNPKKYEWAMFNQVLQLLETMGYITKLPNDSTSGVNVYMWSHNKHTRWDEASIPEWNLSYAILLALKSGGPMKYSDLSKTEQVRELVKHLSVLRPGHQNESVLAHIQSPLRGLEEESLIRIIRAARMNVRITKLYELTPFAIEELALTEQNRYLSERLRVALLGQKRPGLTHHEEDTLHNIIRCLNVLRERKTKAGRVIIARRLHENESYVHSVLQLEARPWTKMSDKTIKKTYLSALKEYFPAYVEDFLRALKDETQPTLFDRLPERENGEQE